MTTVNGHSVVLIVGGVNFSHLIASCQVMIMATGDPDPLRLSTNERRYMAVIEEPEPKPAQPFWTQGRHKKGKRSKY